MSCGQAERRVLTFCRSCVLRIFCTIYKCRLIVKLCIVIVLKGMPMAPMGGPQSSPCPTPAMQGHNQSTGPKPWSDGKSVPCKCETN